MYKSTGLGSQIWLSMYSASAMLVMLYAINSVMDSEWSDWVAWQYSVVTCLYHHQIEPLACQVVKLWTTRGFIFDYFREICTRSSFPRMQSRSLFVFVFFFIRFVKYLSLYILCHSISVCWDIKAIRSSLSGLTTLSAVDRCIKWAPHRNHKNQIDERSVA